MLAVSNRLDHLDRLAVRSRVLQAVRHFFIKNGYIEVETPVRIATPALELHIDAEPAGDGFLRTSPELHMKRLLGEGMTRLFQVGPCFRQGERGDRHRPEYTMLEWYRAKAGYRSVLDETCALLKTVAVDVLGAPALKVQGQTVDLAAKPVVLTVAEAFERWAGWNPVTRYDADRFDVDLVEKVEPALPCHVPVVLTDYPVEAAALARCRPGPVPVAERWELYVVGMELANAFGELIDAGEQRQRFEACAQARKELGKPVYAVDEDFLQALEQGLPDSAGVALGIDRLTMLLTDSAKIDEVCAF